MHTQTHLLLGAAAFGSPGAGRRTAAALAGGALPDLPAIALVLWAIGMQGRDAGEVFRVAYFSDAWQAIMAPWHSAPLWGLGLAAGFAMRSPVLKAFAASGLLHQACDFPLHHDDPHRHLWPLSDWRFESPVSYWDPERWGWLIAPLEIAGALALIAWMFRRWPGRWMRAGLIGAGLLYVVQAGAIIAWAARG